MTSVRAWTYLACLACLAAGALAPVALSSGLRAASVTVQLPRDALTFHASFDGRIDADVATGDPRLYWTPSMKQHHQAVPGLPGSGEVTHVADAGRHGGALRFTARKSPVVFFRGARNVAYAASEWAGTVSFWLQTDPVRDLEPGFCDPVQITPRAWNDAAFFVEFEKRADSIPFRLGTYADLAVWNPHQRRFADIPQGERPLITVDNPPFASGRWTHVLFTFEHFNTGRTDGVVRLYLDGTLGGTLTGRQQTFTWDLSDTTIALGLGYIGLIDDLAIFSRALDQDEIRALHIAPDGWQLRRP